MFCAYVGAYVGQWSSLQLKGHGRELNWIYRHHIGYVTTNQFKQCLVFLALETSVRELDVLNARFPDAKGFNYLQFLEQVEPMEKLENKYRTRAIEIKSSKDKVCKTYYW